MIFYMKDLMNLSNIAINEENALQVMLHTKIWTAIIMFVLPFK